VYRWCKLVYIADVLREQVGGGDLQNDQTCGLWCCQMQALFVNMDTYLQGLFSLANDSAAEVRKLVSKLWYTNCVWWVLLTSCLGVSQGLWIVQGGGVLVVFLFFWQFVWNFNMLWCDPASQEFKMWLLVELQVCAGLVQLLEVQPSYLQVCSLALQFCIGRDCNLHMHG